MKRIDALIPTMRRSEVVNSILSAGAKGVTIVESRGKGDGYRPMMELKHGKNSATNCKKFWHSEYGN